MSKEHNPFDKLSLREEEVLSYILPGKKIIEISAILGLKKNTISTHKKNIYKKIGVATMIDLYKKSNEYGIMI